MSEAMESMVNVTKSTLQTIIKETTFTDNTIYTIIHFTQLLLNRVNSQWLTITNVSDNINDYEALTPNHFLLGQLTNNNPVINNEEVDVTLQNTWKTVQTATNMFWSRWTREYLPRLTEQKQGTMYYWTHGNNCSII